MQLEKLYTSHIRGGLDFAQNILNQFEKNPKIQTIQLNIKGSLKGEERIQKYDRMSQQFKIIAQNTKITKKINKNKEDLSKFAKKFQIEVFGFLKKVNQNQMQN